MHPWSVFASSWCHAIPITQWDGWDLAVLPLSNISSSLPASSCCCAVVTPASILPDIFYHTVSEFQDCLLKSYLGLKVSEQNCTKQCFLLLLMKPTDPGLFFFFLNLKTNDAICLLIHMLYASQCAFSSILCLHPIEFPYNMENRCCIWGGWYDAVCLECRFSRRICMD